MHTALFYPEYHIIDRNNLETVIEPTLNTDLYWVYYLLYNNGGIDIFRPFQVFTGVTKYKSEQIRYSLIEYNDDGEKVVEIDFYGDNKKTKIIINSITGNNREHVSKNIYSNLMNKVIEMISEINENRDNKIKLHVKKRGVLDHSNAKWREKSLFGKFTPSTLTRFNLDDKLIWTPRTRNIYNKNYRDKTIEQLLEQKNLPYDLDSVITSYLPKKETHFGGKSKKSRKSKNMKNKTKKVKKTIK
jgi:hypothetical protein